MLLSLWSSPCVYCSGQGLFCNRPASQPPPAQYFNSLQARSILLYVTLFAGAIQYFEILSFGGFGEHWLELQALVAPRIFFFCNLFLGSEYFAQRFNRPLDKNGRDISETLKKLPYLTGLLKLSKLPTFSKRCPQCLTSLLLKTRCYMLCQK